MSFSCVEPDFLVVSVVGVNSPNIWRLDLLTCKMVRMALFPDHLSGLLKRQTMDEKILWNGEMSSKEGLCGALTVHR